MPRLMTFFESCVFVIFVPNVFLKYYLENRNIMLDFPVIIICSIVT